MKIPPEAHDTLRELATFAARNGWAAPGIDRDDPPTQTALIEEAIKLLATRKADRKRPGRP